MSEAIIYINFQATLSNMVPKLLHLHFTGAKMTSQNRVQMLAFMPILDLAAGLGVGGSSQQAEWCNAGVAQYVEDRD